MTASPRSTTRFAPLSLHNVSLPDHLVVSTTRGNLLTDFNSFGFDGERFFGIAFIQGKRLQFATAMPIKKMLAIARIDRADPGSRVAEVQEHANRPRVPAHSKALRRYLEDNACGGEKFILPAFALNFGDEKTMRDDWPDAQLRIYAPDSADSSNGWPAMLELPNPIQLDMTDGAHRGSECAAIVNSSSLSQDLKDNLSRNAVDVKIIFERKRVDAHQDFADCAKARPITGSLISTFDIRDLRNKRARDMVNNIKFLHHYVDATAANINLSANSAKIWSMSAVRGFVGYVVKNTVTDPREVAAALERDMHGAEHFFNALIKQMPELRALEKSRQDEDAGREPEVTPGILRNTKGGDVALRGVGMSLFARAFEYAKDNNLVFDDVAKTLGQVNWNVLDCERSQLPASDTEDGRAAFKGAVAEHMNPLWASMIIVGESRYRIGSTNAEVDQAWERILANYFDAAPAQAAE